MDIIKNSTNSDTDNRLAPRNSPIIPPYIPVRDCSRTILNTTYRFKKIIKYFKSQKYHAKRNNPIFNAQRRIKPKTFPIFIWFT